MIAGLILAGGAATRMGGLDKPLLPLGGRAIMDFVLERVRPQVGAVAISANGDPDRYMRFCCPVLADDVRGRGPLGGVLRGLVWAKAIGAEALLTVPGDTPFVPGDLVARLGIAASCAENAAGVHWPVAIWPVACVEKLAWWLSVQPSGRVSAFAEILGMQRIWFDDMGDPFHNVNTLEDLELARRNV